VQLRAGSRRPVLALLFLSPTIAEFLTGSTSVTTLFLDPFGFLVQLLFLLGLYGGGVILIREFTVVFRKGWATVLLLGAAYGIAEEGLSVHTFFQRHGPPVDALATYGSLGGVNWLWALVLTVFHATYSIALPLLIVWLWWPETREERWLDPGWTTIFAVAYVGTVSVFAFTVGHGPTPAILALFLGVEALLLAAAYLVPRDLLRLRSDRGPFRPWRVGAAGALGMVALFTVYFFSDSRLVPAVACAAIFVAVDLLAVYAVAEGSAGVNPEQAAYCFALGMFVAECSFTLLILPGDPAAAIVVAVMA
jgi:hypothetical protein